MDKRFGHLPLPRGCQRLAEQQLKKIFLEWELFHYFFDHSRLVLEKHVQISKSVLGPILHLPGTVLVVVDVVVVVVVVGGTSTLQVRLADLVGSQ